MHESINHPGFHCVSSRLHAIGGLAAQQHHTFRLPALFERSVTQRRGMLGYGARLVMVLKIDPDGNVHLTQPTRLAVSILFGRIVTQRQSSPDAA